MSEDVGVGRAGTASLLEEPASLVERKRERDEAQKSVGR